MGCPVYCPCSLPTQRPPTFSTPGHTRDGSLRVSPVRHIYRVCVSVCVCCVNHVSEALWLQDS